MKFQYTFVGLLSALILVGQVAQAENQVAASPDRRPVVTDVALHDGGVLYGQVVNDKGMAAVDTDVMLFQQDRQVAASRTSRDGQFRMTGLKAGVYRLSTPNGSSYCRLWAPHTAPPTAQPAVVVVEDLVVRGQDGVKGKNGFDGRCHLRRAALITGGALGVAGVVVAIDHNPAGS